MIALAALPASLVPGTGTGTFEAPAVDWVAAGPVAAVLGAAVLGVLVEAFAPRRGRRTVQMLVAGVGLLVALCFVVVLWRDGDPRSVLVAANDPQASAMVLDKVALFLQATLVLLTALSLLVLGEKGTDRRLEAFAAQPATGPGTPEEAAAERAGRETTDVFPLAMFALGGMMVFAAAADLLTMFVALEVLSLPLYIMSGLARRRRLLSQEASLKYFLLGAFSSALFLFGMALVYGVTGTVNLGGIGQALQNGGDVRWTAEIPVLVVGAFLIVVGLLFKIGAVPFHAWTPDVYTGAPTSVTGFMAACTKVAAFGALVRVLYVSLPALEEVLQPALWTIAALTMVVGSLVAIRQTDVKRMLAYSSIAHAGFILTGLVTVQQEGVVGVLFYVLAYGLSTVACFGIVTIVRESDEDGGVGGEATHLSQWAGLGRRSPLLAGIFAFFLLAFAGIPLTSGFMGKYAVFSAAWASDAQVLVVVGVLASAIAAFFYVRVIVLMFFSEPAADGPTVAVPSAFTTLAVGIGLTVTVVLGVLPQPVLDLAGQAAELVR